MAYPPRRKDFVSIVSTVSNHRLLLITVVVMLAVTGFSWSPDLPPLGRVSLGRLMPSATSNQRVSFCGFGKKI